MRIGNENIMELYGKRSEQKENLEEICICKYSSMGYCCVYGVFDIRVFFHYNSTWLEWTITFIGVAGISVGFFGGLIFAMNEQR